MTAGVRIVGTGAHHLTKLIDAATGEDLSRRYGVRKITYVIGDKDAFPESRLIVEMVCPVEFAFTAPQPPNPKG